MNRDRGNFLVIVVLFVIISGCAGRTGGFGPTATPQPPGQAASTLRVFAAASLSDAFQEIGAEFHKQNPGVPVEFNFAGSQQLAQQIVQGAPADVFASANNKQMDILIQQGEVTSGQEKVFAQNRLVVIFPKDNPANINRLKDLAKPGIKVLLAAKEVPAGQYALDFLAKASQTPGFGQAYQQDVLKNVVSYEENVRGIFSKIKLGEADAGIVYSSDTHSPGGESVGSLAIPDSLNSLASYPIAPLAKSRSQDQAAAFIGYVLSPAGQAILQKYGFLPAAP